MSPNQIIKVWAAQRAIVAAMHQDGRRAQEIAAVTGMSRTMVVRAVRALER